MGALHERQLIDKIRAYIHSVDQTKNDELEALARDYAEVCRKANERLTRCADFLEKGLHTQAIEIAEAEPDLLEVTSVLTFAELDEWQELVGAYGLERFQTIKVEVAEQVSRAYDVDHQLAALLKQNRRLALAKAPLRDRLGVLRQLASVDATTAYWHDDVLTLEKHRASELVDLANRAAKNRDTKGVKQLVTEFESEHWMGEIPTTVQCEYNKVARGYYESQELPELAEAICASLRNLNISSLSLFRQQWNAIVDRIRRVESAWRPPQALVAAVKPAFAYLDQQQETLRINAFHEDIVLLQQAMRSQAGDQQVSFYLAKAESHGMPLPPMVLAELQEYRSGVKEARALNVAVIVVLVFAAIAGIVFAFFMFREMFSRE